MIFNKIDNEITRLRQRLESKLKGSSYTFGMSDYPGNIKELKRNYTRCMQAIKIGKILYPDNIKINYSQLGPFAWLDIQDDELESIKNRFHKLLDKDGKDDLIQTLKIYLECNMNYSQTAKAMFLHINTIRKRIDQISEVIEFDLDNPINRLTLEILLQLLY